MKSLNITIFGEKNIPKLELFEKYISNKGKQEGIKNKKDKKDGNGISIEKKFSDDKSMKLNIYEYYETKKVKDIDKIHCVIIVFDMTNREAFEDILNKWVKFLRDKNYKGHIILLGTNNSDNKNDLPMTDAEEATYLIEVAELNAEFYDIRDKGDKEISKLIDDLIVAAYNNYKNNMNNKNCIIY